MSHEHIASAFDRDLEGIQANIMRMGGLVEDAIAKAEELLALGDALEECEQDFAKRWKKKPKQLRSLSNAIRKVAGAKYGQQSELLEDLHRQVGIQLRRLRGG